jgi:hypothetical protein
MATAGLSSLQEHDTKEGTMRQFYMVLLVAVAAGFMPAVVWADNPNQEAAQKIRDHITDSGQLVVGDKIAVRYLNGTVWLQGHVRDQDQLNKAVALVFATQGVTISQVIRDELTCDSAKPGSPSNSSATKSVAASAANPLRGASDRSAGVNRAQALPSSFSQGHAATPVAMMQPVPPAPAPPVSAPGKLPAAETTTGVPGAPLPMYAPGAAAGGPAPMRYDRPAMPAYAWPSYAAYPNYAALTYPKQYSPTAWPYIGPFYPYPQVPLGWRKISLEWDDGWWWLDFKDKPRCCWWR